MEEFVKSRGGTRVIRKVLVANNGIGAVKCIRSIRRFAYETVGNERAIQFVVMATPEDMRANAEYIRMADEIVDVPGGSNNNNYANVMLIVEIAERWNVDAVWAGWGHASENPLLPNSLAATSRNIQFIGPPGAPMQALGDKIGSTIIAQSAGVPCISWNGDGLKCSYKDGGQIPPDVYAQASVNTSEKALEVCDRIGFPVMIKASEGGGGKGIRKVLERSQVVTAHRQVASEVPGSPIFVMKLAGESRHLEVQLLADQYGEAIALNGRDCSVQRRHQKIVEEGPPLAAPPKVWREMEKAAIGLAKEVGYVNAGTVEYLFTAEGFFFLELNPRLQVEHPVTEMITKVNLPAAQLQVAMGIPLQNMPDVRRLYGRDPDDTGDINFDDEEQVAPQNHCIAVRITAENPDLGFQPTSGNIQEINFRSTPDVWGYFSVDSSGLVHEFADSQFGHLFANGADREAARKNMTIALKELSIRGDIRTTVEYIVDMMGTEDFMNNNINTAWLDARIAESKEGMIGVQRTQLDSGLVVTVGSIVMAYQEASRRSELFCEMLEKGLTPPKELTKTSQDVELIYEGTKYLVLVAQCGPKTFAVQCNEGYVQAECRSLADGGYLVVVNGKSQVAYAKMETTGLRLVINGNTCIFTKEYDPTNLEAEVAGKFVRQLVPEGAHLQKGEPYAEVEVMKMYMSLTVSEAGTVHWQMQEGASLAPGDKLAVLDLDDSSAVTKAELFTGMLSTAAEETVTASRRMNRTDSAMSVAPTDRPHVALRKATSVLEMVLWGYNIPLDIFQKSMEDLKQAVADPLLPLNEFTEALAVLAGRLDMDLYEQLKALADAYRAGVGEGSAKEFPADKILPLLHEHGLKLAERDRAAFFVMVDSVKLITEQYVHGVVGRTVFLLLNLLQQYLEVERAFTGTGIENALAVLRKTNSGQLSAVYDMARSHAAIEMKNALLTELLDDVNAAAMQLRSKSPSSPSPNVDLNAFLPVLAEIGALPGEKYGVVASKARQIQFLYDAPPIEARRQKLKDAIKAGCEAGDATARMEVVEEFLAEAPPMEDVMMGLFGGEDSTAVSVAAEIYVRSMYRTHAVVAFEQSDKGSAEAALNCSKWSFLTQRTEGLATSGSTSFADLSTLSQAVSATSGEESDGSTTGGGGATSDTETGYGSIPSNVTRYGALAVVSCVEEMEEKFDQVLSNFPQFTKSAPRCAAGAVNALHVIVLSPLGATESPAADAGETEGPSQDDVCGEKIAAVLERLSDKLVQADVRRATVVIPISTAQDSPGIFTYRSRTEFAKEDVLFRHIEPSYASSLDLPRLSNFSIRVSTSMRYQGGNVHLYMAVPKRSEAHKAGLKGPILPRYFARVVTVPEETRAAGGGGSDGKKYYVERMFVQALNRLDAAVSEAEQGAHVQEGKKAAPQANNHIFINVLVPDDVVEPATVGAHMKQLMLRFQEKITRLGVSHFELKVVCRLSKEGGASVPIRLIATNPTGYVVRINTYVEVREGTFTVFRTVGGAEGSDGEWEGKSVVAPYPVARPFEQKRLLAQTRSDTLFVYDWLELIEAGVKEQWSEYALQRPHDAVVRPQGVMHAVELVVKRKGGAVKDSSGVDKLWQASERSDLVLEKESRPAGKNDVGMVAWLVTLRTPEYPIGRQVVVIANDITFEAGSFGTREDMVFLLASEFSRAHGLPRVYLSVNSGARIGMSASVKKRFQIAWTNPEDPTVGYKYLYLTPEDYTFLAAKNAVNCEMVVDEQTGDTRYKILDIVGDEPDLGVENLQGSGTIAGETSLAYDDVFTLTLVVGRSVGIGAYLVRLGQRTIQKRTASPIILTGYQALNTLMGREVYISNDQLGGPAIMGPNGVSHHLVDNHMEAITTSLRWISYVPNVKNSILPVMDITGSDMVERSIEMQPQQGQTYDPRHLLAGLTDELTGEWASGFFDKGSFTESLAEWAKTVVCGRARLGGIPMGVIYTENRLAEKMIPADPADMTSNEKVVQQAGAVWFPDSANKTAQAIRDINREGLPLMVFANWRGFSGGGRDMFDEVLKFGAHIVDALVAYKQPCFVYIPPWGELRGGAWVVVDSTINAEVMEMYAANDARGGVLEANGAASIKFRTKDMVAAAHRLDPELRKLDAVLAAGSDPDASASERLDAQQRRKVLSEIAAREKRLMGVYQQLAVQFADLHDTPGRMQAVGVIEKEVPWVSARSFFYWRLRRRLAEFDLRKDIMRASPETKPLEASALAKEWFVASGKSEETWKEDKAVLSWLADSGVGERVKQLRSSCLTAKMESMVKDAPEAALSGLLNSLRDMDKATKQKILAQLTKATQGDEA